MSMLDRKLRRDLASSKLLLTAIVAIIAAGIACFVGMASTYRSLETARLSYYAQSRMADFWLDLKKAPNAAVEALVDLAGVAEVRHRIVFSVVVDLEEADKPVGGLVLSMPDEPVPVINNFVLRRGGYFSGGRRAEVIVSEAFAKARRISPGTFLHLIFNGERRRVLVVGTAISAEHTYLMPPGSIVPDASSYGVFYVKRSFAEEVFDFEGACNSVVGLLTPATRIQPDETLRRITASLDRYGVFETTPQSQQASNMALTNELAGLRVSAVIMPVIFLGVAALVLNVLMSRLAEQQRTIVGTLKALGYRNAQLFGHFVKYGLVVGLTGGVVGCALGQWMALGYTTIYERYFEFPDLECGFFPGLMGTGLLISAGCAVLGALRGVRAVMRLHAAEAMHPRPPAAGGAVILERWDWLWRRLDFRWHMVLRGVLRHRFRTAMGLVASALAAALVAVGLGSNDSLRHMLDLQFDKLLTSDYDLGFRDELDYGAVDEARRLPGVSAVEPTLTVACTFHHGHRRKKVAITGLVAGAKLTVPHDAAGRPVRPPPAGLLMSRRVADALDLGAGDTVRTVPVKGARAARDVPVAGIVEVAFGLAVYADYDYLNRLVGEAAAVNGVQLKARHTAAQRSAFFRNLKRYPNVQGVVAVSEMQREMEAEFIDQLLLMLAGIIMFAGVILFGSILNASLISLAERQREVATFRAMGYRADEVGGIFLRENMVVNVIGASAGVPLGYWLIYLMAVEFSNDLFTMAPVFRPLSMILTVAVAVLFVLASHVIVQRALKRIDWPEAIKLKE